jgi:hypothetical protein
MHVNSNELMCWRRRIHSQQGRHGQKEQLLWQLFELERKTGVKDRRVFSEHNRKTVQKDNDYWCAVYDT